MRVQTLRMPEPLAKRLEALARSTRRTKSSCILEAVERYLDEREDLEVSLARIRDPGAEWLDHAEVKRAALKD